MDQTEESNTIDSILPSLRNNGLLTDIECRVIAFAKPLEKKQAAIYRVMTSKRREVGASLTEMFITLLGTNENCSDSVSPRSVCGVQKYNSSSLVRKESNPMLNKMIVKHLFGFLNLKDIKNFRFVCRQWNSTAELCIRKSYAFHFQSNFVKPATFYEYSKYCLPDLPSQAFKFSGTWCVLKLKNFFDNWGKYVKEVHFSNLILQIEENSQMWFAHYDISPWLANAVNLSTLKIERRENYALTLLNVSLNKLPTTIKTLSLSGCGILSSKNAINQCAPKNISLANITVKSDGQILEDFCYNDIIDFSRAKSIYLNNRIYCGRIHYNRPYRTALFNMASQVFKTDQVHLDYVSVENWGEARGYIRYLRTEGCPFGEKSHLEIKELNFSNYELDLSVIPKTVQKLELAFIKGIRSSEPIQLPNLKSLFIQSFYSNSCVNFFENCPNLVQLNLTRDVSFSPWKLNLALIPQSVKKLSLVTPKIKFFEHDSVLKVDTLIMAQYCKGYTNYDEITAKIQAKILIVKCRDMDFDLSDIIKLVRIKHQPQKIIIGLHSCNFDVHIKNPFEESVMSRCMDKKANYYLFENQMGKAISREEFENWMF